MLDILEKFLIRKGYSFARLDGSTPTNLRQSLVDDFNESPSKQVSITVRKRSAFFSPTSDLMSKRVFFCVRFF